MTEQTSEKAPLVFQDEMHRLQFQMLSELITKRNELVGRANAANGDRLTLTEQIRENSTDPAIMEARERMSEWALKLDELVKPQVDAIIADAAGSQESLETEIKELDSKLKPGVTYFKKMYDDGSAEHFPTQERLKGTTVRSGGGGRRVRGYNVIVTIDGESKEHENFATAAKYIDVDTVDLQNAFFEKAGTDKLKDAPDVVNMVINFTEVDEDGNQTEKEALVKAYRTEPLNATGGNSEAKPAEQAEVANDEVDEDVDFDEDDLENL